MKKKVEDYPTPPSQDFEDAFSSGCPGCRRTCEGCGREFFDTGSSYAWEPGELQGLRACAMNDPDKYREVSWSIGAMELVGRSYVIGCPCNGATRFENWIKNHDRQLAKYLNERSRLLEEHGHALRVAGVLAGERPEDVIHTPV